MRVGHGAAQLEMVVGEPMGGYADRAKGVKGTLDPLEVHAVTFADEGHRFAMIAADLVCVNTDIVERIRAAVRPLGIDSCWVAATHTHASPEAGCFPGGTATPAGLGDRLLTAALAAAEAAVAHEHASTLHPTRVQVAELAGWRNLTDSPVDVPVDALVVADRDTVLGVIVVCPVHPTVLGADNTHLSADLSGGIRRALSDGDRWVVVATGSAGNISTRHTRRGRRSGEIDRLGSLVAENLTVDELVVSSPGRVRPPVMRVVDLAPKLPDEADHDIRVDHDPSRSDERSRLVLEQGRQIARDLVAQGRRAPYECGIQAVGLGPVTVIAVPAELFLELGESIRSGVSAANGSSVIVLGYTNGYLGYLTSHDAPPTYETLVSPVRRGSGEQVVAAAVELAQAVADTRSTT